MTVFRYFKKLFLQKCLIFKRLGTESSRNPAKLYSPLDIHLVVSLCDVLISVLMVFSYPVSTGKGVSSGNICQHRYLRPTCSAPSHLTHFSFIFVCLSEVHIAMVCNVPANTIYTNIFPISILKRKVVAPYVYLKANQNMMLFCFVLF